MKNFILVIAIIFALTPICMSIGLHGTLSSRTRGKTSTKTRTKSRTYSRSSIRTGTRTKSKAMLRESLRQIISILSIPAQDAKLLEAFEESYPTINLFLKNLKSRKEELSQDDLESLMMCRSISKSVKRQLKEMQNIGLVNQKLMMQADEIHFNIEELSSIENEALLKVMSKREIEIEADAKKELNSTSKIGSENEVSSMDYKIQTTKIHALESELQLMRKRLQLYMNIFAAGKINVGVIIDSNFTLLENFLEEYNVLSRNSESLYNRMLQYENEISLDKKMIKKNKFQSMIKKIKNDFYSIKDGLDIVTKFVLVAAREDLENENLIRDFLNSKSFRNSNIKFEKNKNQLNWKYIKESKDNSQKSLSASKKITKIMLHPISGFENLEKFVRNEFKNSIKNYLLSFDSKMLSINMDKLFLGIQNTWNTTAVETFSIMARNYMIKKAISYDCGFEMIENLQKEFKFLQEDIADERNEEKNNSKAIQFLMTKQENKSIIGEVMKECEKINSK